MYAKTFKGFISPGSFISEKLDGIRAFWDGGVSRGLRPPWSNDHKESTGLWSRYGKVILAPDWWLDTLPPMLMDGELWCGRNMWQLCSSIVRGRGDWTKVQFKVFDSPSADVWLAPGPIQKSVTDKRIITPDSYEWFQKHKPDNFIKIPQTGFMDVYKRLKDTGFAHEQIQTYSQTLPELPPEAEGWIIRTGLSSWEPTRSSQLMKHKSWHDSEGLVLSHNPGKGKYEGMLGSIKVAWKGVTFDLSGFTDEERNNPPSIGSMITFKYRELSDGGVPKEARYFRRFESI